MAQPKGTRRRFVKLAAKVYAVEGDLAWARETLEKCRPLITAGVRSLRSVRGSWRRHEGKVYRAAEKRAPAHVREKALRVLRRHVPELRERFLAAEACACEIEDAAYMVARDLHRVSGVLADLLAEVGAPPEKEGSAAR